MLRYVIGGFLAAGVLAFLVMLLMSQTPPQGSPRALARGTVASFEFLEDAEPAPETAFVDSAGNEVTLADFRGKVLLVNLWATWCGPCKTEMPTLDALQADMGGEEFQVLAISMDRDGPDVARQFLERAGLGNLALYNDRTGRMVGKFAVRGLPFTIVIDRQSRVAGRLIGPAEWNRPEAKALLRHYIEK